MLWIALQLLLSPVAWSAFRIIHQDSNFITGEASNQNSFNLEITKKQKYSEAEQTALYLFRRMVNGSLERDNQKTDAFLIPWIRVADMDLPKAKEMLEEALKWRKEYRMDGILNETVVELKVNHCLLDGTDNDGNPLVFMHSAREIDVRKWALQGRINSLLRYMLKCVERTVVKARYLAKTTGKNIAQCIPIIDLGGFNLKTQACLQCIRTCLDFFTIIQNYYPDSAKQVILLNVPPVAKHFISVVKGLMTEHTAKVLRYKVFGTDRNEWTKYLLGIIPSDQLPVQYGGTRTESQDNENDVSEWLGVLESNSSSDSSKIIN